MRMFPVVCEGSFGFVVNEFSFDYDYDYPKLQNKPLSEAAPTALASSA